MFEEQQSAFAVWQASQNPKVYPAEGLAFVAGWQAALESTRVKALRDALNVANEALEEISNEMIFGDRWTNAGQSLLDALPITRAALSQGDV
jgi:hypothetical protein